MPRQDPRRVVGARVSAKANAVTNDAECARRYGSNRKTKLLYGVVSEICNEPTKTGRANWFLRCTFMLSAGVAKEAKVNIRFVQHAPLDDDVANPNDPPPVNAGAPAIDIPTEPVVDAIVPVTESPVQEVGVLVVRPPTPPTCPPNEDTDTEDSLEANAPTRIVVPPVLYEDGVIWEEDNEKVLMDQNGPLAERRWSLKTCTGDILTAGCELGKIMSRLDYFLLMFPPQQMLAIVRLTNNNLREKNIPLTSNGEILRYFGVCILATRYQFASRRDLWSTSSRYKYQYAPSFGKTGMPRNRFDILWQHIQFCEQPKERPEGMSHAVHRWLLVDGFVNIFNEYRDSMMSPAELICVDESMSRWYGNGGEWINCGLPMYVAIDRKPENGAEIQDASCGVSGIMIRLKVVKGVVDREADDNNEMLHGAKVLLGLVLPWINTHRLVCADSYFASVPSAILLHDNGLKFVGVVKTATKKFPMKHLSSVKLKERGDTYGMVRRKTANSDECDLLAYVWMDRDRRYFIASGSSMAEGKPYKRRRLRQVSEEDNAEPEHVDLEVRQPKASELYYSACAMVDRHNRCRQDDLDLEKKLGTQDWSKRFNMSLLGICIVDTWLAYSQVTQNKHEIQSEFYSFLAEELIDNRVDEGVRGRVRRRHTQDTFDEASPVIAADGTLRCGVSVHLTPTKRKRKNNAGHETSYLLQGQCMICKKKLRIFVMSVRMTPNG